MKARIPADASYTQQARTEGAALTATQSANRNQTRPKTAAEIFRTEAAARQTGAVVVEIYDQIYQLTGTDPEHIERLAALVDGKMRAVSASGSTVDSLRVAVLAALNFADELVELRVRYDALRTSSLAESAVQSRAGSLVHMLDAVLEERKAG